VHSQTSRVKYLRTMSWVRFYRGSLLGKGRIGWSKQGQRQTCSFSQQKIMEMQCDLLISNLKGPKTIVLMKENIKHVSDGSSPHCGGALKLGFKKAFELKKQEGGVLLRCPNSGCEWHKWPVSCSTLGSSTLCQRCGSNNRKKRLMECAGCKSARAKNYADSCEGCGKWFL